MRATFLLAIGLVFLSLALTGAIYLSILQKSAELSSTTASIPGETFQPATAISVIDVTKPPPTRTNTPLPPPTNTPPTSTPPISTPTTTPGAGAGTRPPSSCDQAELVGDVNIPDGTILAPGATFTKRWRLKNVGSCAWSPTYQVVFFSGEQLGAPVSIPFPRSPRSVPPGGTLDVSVNLTAPSAAGTYRGYWIFKNANGILFGIGPQANQPFWVEIKVSGPTVTPGGLPSITSTPPPTLPVMDIPTQIVEVEWPPRLKVGQSGTIRISLVKVGGGYIPTVEIQGNTAVASTPIPVGTPGEEPRYAFGKKYEAYAIAHIAGAPFDISLASPEAQALDQPRLDWVWNLTSDHPGLQGIDVSVEIEWRPVDPADKPLNRQIWRSHLEVEVFQSILSTGQVSAFSLLSAFLGSGLSIPWLYERLSKRKSQRRKDKKRP